MLVEYVLPPEGREGVGRATPAPRVVFFEGILALHSERLRDLMDLKIFVDADWHASSMCCFLVVRVDHGSDKPHYDLELLPGARGNQVGILACEWRGIFSDRDGEVALGAPLLTMEDTDAI